MKILSLILGLFCIILLAMGNGRIERVEATTSEVDAICKNPCDVESMTVLHAFIELQTIEIKAAVKKINADTLGRMNSRIKELERIICFSKQSYLKELNENETDYLCDKFKF